MSEAVVEAHSAKAREAVKLIEELGAACPYCHGHAIGDECERCSVLAEAAYNLKAEANPSEYMALLIAENDPDGG